jgi:hypothetical protein
MLKIIKWLIVAFLSFSIPFALAILLSGTK